MQVRSWWSQLGQMLLPQSINAVTQHVCQSYVPNASKERETDELVPACGVCVCGVSWGSHMESRAREESYCWCAAMPTMHFGHESPLPHSPVLQSPALHRLNLLLGFSVLWSQLLWTCDVGLTFCLRPRLPTKQGVFRSLGPVLLGYAGKLEVLVGVPF